MAGAKPSTPLRYFLVMARAKPRTQPVFSFMAGAKPSTPLRYTICFAPCGGVCVYTPRYTGNLEKKKSRCRSFVRFSHYSLEEPPFAANVCPIFAFQTGGQRGWGGVSGQRRRPPPHPVKTYLFFQNGKRLSQGPHNSARRFN